MVTLVPVSAFADDGGGHFGRGPRNRFQQSFGCTSLQSLAYMQNTGNPPSNAVYMPISSNHTFYVQCYSNTTKFSGPLGSAYTGYLIINYTNAYTLFPTTVYGKMSTRVSR